MRDADIPRPAAKSEFTLNEKESLNRDMGTQHRDRLIVFSRYPTPGKTKTRLIPALGRRGAADLSRWMTALALSRSLRVRAALPLDAVDIHLFHSGGSSRKMRRLFLGGERSVPVAPQGDGDLGDRMHRALARAGRDGIDRAVLFGTDIPDLTADIISGGLFALDDADLVLGPAVDGGYYLVGAGEKLLSPGGDDILRDIFSDIPWETESVLDLTLKKAESHGLTVTLLERLPDVDEPSDLSIWERALSGRYAIPPDASISVIIPTKNEEPHIGHTISALGTDADTEVIVVDGFSTDNTREVALKAGASVISAPPPRVRQLNRAAAIAQGDILFILHADTEAPSGFADLIRETLSRPNVAACSFSLGIRGEGWKLRWVERNATRRSIQKGLPYGDQGICIGRELFLDAGGFREMPIMEDYEFVRRIGRYGSVVTLPHRTYTSPRRWETLGLLRTTMTNQAIILAYHLGVNPSRLARWYRRESGIERKQNR